MSVDMDKGHLVVQNFGPLAEEVVYRLAYNGLIARDGGGRDYDRIPQHDADIPVVSISNAYQG